MCRTAQEMIHGVNSSRRTSKSRRSRRNSSSSSSSSWHTSSMLMTTTMMKIPMTMWMAMTLRTVAIAVVVAAPRTVMSRLVSLSYGSRQATAAATKGHGDGGAGFAFTSGLCRISGPKVLDLPWRSMRCSPD